MGKDAAANQAGKFDGTIHRKNLGAFYTPKLYAEKSLELVRMAIDRVPSGNDYIILDRCAGTGNLEAGMTAEELSHCIVSTIEYHEYQTLREQFDGKVRLIIPPIKNEPDFFMGADALSEDFLHEKLIRQYIDNPKCTIILFENPPFAETTSIEHQKKNAGKTSSAWKDSCLMREMRKDPEVKGTAYNDLANLFIWSGFKLYLRQPTDSYIVYSPIKYWKAHALINKKFLKGFAFNRRHFHTNIDACIVCALWSAEDALIEDFCVDAYDIDKNERLIFEGTLPIKRVHSSFSQRLYDKRAMATDKKGGIYVEFDGTESPAGRSSVRIRPITNENIIAYLAVKGSNFDNPDSSVHLLRVAAYDANGFYVRSDNYLEKLSMFCASRYITYNGHWTERSRVMKSADLADEYLRDVKSGTLQHFLIKCLIFTCLDMQNHCRSFTGSDGIDYRNELCLDGTCGDTLALRDVKAANLDENDEKLLQAWEVVLSEAKKCREYRKNISYGVFQIHSEIDTFEVDEEGNKTFHHAKLHYDMQALRTALKSYYNEEIVPTLFRYDFLK